MKTSKSLLIRAKQNQKNEAWFKLVAIYEPLIAGWLRRYRVSETDILDLTQEVLLTISTQLSFFHHNGRPGAFRNWLRRISLNRARRHWAERKRQVPVTDVAELSDELITDPQNEHSKLWEIEHDKHVLEKILQFVAREFEERTMVAFRRAAIDEEPAKTIASDLNLSVGQVYKYKYRVMKRLLAEAQGLIEMGEHPMQGPPTGLLSDLSKSTKKTA